MNDERVAEVLAAYAEGLVNQPEAGQPVHVIEIKEERGRLAPLFKLTERLQQSMQPVQPSAAFVRSLGKQLMDSARRQIALTKRLRRAMLIGAAALGSLLSIASVVGAILFVVARLRARAQARAIQAPTG
jgi:F0F1-type ATP synthase membrane subunit c/vacuolar-type H+-ATPase subunit K